MDVAGSLLFWLVRPLFSATGPVPLAPPPTAVFIITSTLVVALAIVIAVSSKLRRRLHRGPHGQNARAGLTKLEETGIIDMAAIYAAVIFFMYGLFLESSLCAFAFGIGTIYFLDHASSYIHRKRLRHIRSQGVALYLEEFCVFEIALLIAAVYVFSTGAYLYGALLFWVFGMVFAALVDRVRLRRGIRR